MPYRYFKCRLRFQVNCTRRNGLTDFDKDSPASPLSIFEVIDYKRRNLSCQSQELLHDKLQFVFLELDRFNKSESELEDIYDKWMFLLKNMSELSKRPDTCDEKEFDKLFELAKICNFTPDEYRDYQNSQKMNYDNQNIIDYAKQTGREEGLEKGREEGRKETGIEIARNMLEKGLPQDVISSCTGISVEEIMKLS